MALRLDPKPPAYQAFPSTAPDCGGRPVFLGHSRGEWEET